MEDAASGVQTTIGVVSLITTLIPYKITWCGTCESTRFDSGKTFIDSTMAKVCAPICTGGPTHVFQACFFEQIKLHFSIFSP